MKPFLLRAALFCLFAVALPGCRRVGRGPDGSGTIECTQVRVAPQVGGRILALPPREGDSLRKGDLVARIDPAGYELARDEARAALALAQAGLDLTLAGAREEDVRGAGQRVKEARALADAAEADRKRIRAVLDKGSGTQKQMDDAAAHADGAAAAHAAAEENLAKLTRGARPEEIRIARAQAEQAKARLAQADKAVADCVVAAPSDGIVTTKSREEGEVVAVGAPLVTISRLDEVWLSIYVPETRLGRVKLGQTARVRTDGDGRAYEGRVTFVAPEAEFTPRNVQTPDDRAKLVYRVKITLKNPDGVFKPGMPADGYLEAEP
jgi:HlyD family secretion protein